MHWEKGATGRGEGEQERAGFTRVERKKGHRGGKQKNKLQKCIFGAL